MPYKNPPKKNQFKKGESGNPKGKPPGTFSLTKKFREALMRIQEGKDGKKIEIADALVAAGLKRALAGDEKMIRLIWNYMDGMPKMHFEGTADIELNIFTDEQITNIAKRILDRNKKGGKRSSRRLPDGDGEEV